MKNCLVTQFKMSVDNDNLPYFDGLQIKVAQSKLDNFRIFLGASSPCRVFAVGDCTMYVGNTAITGNDTEITSGDIYIKNKQEDIIVNIIGRSKIIDFMAYQLDCMSVNVDAFKEEYIPRIRQLLLGNATGNINSLVNNLNLITLGFANSPLLTGDEKGLFNSLRANGKITGSTPMEYYRTNCPKITNTVSVIGGDYTHRGQIYFMEDTVTYPNGWVVNIPLTGKWYDSNGNEISEPEQ